MRRLAAFLAFFFCFLGCRVADKSLVYTEEGLRAADEMWDAYYEEKAEACRAKYRPKTPEMEDCFGKTFDADTKVAQALRSAVGLLRAYWVARAAGENPDYVEVMRQVDEILRDLPPEARRYFNRVRGIR